MKEQTKEQIKTLTDKLPSDWLLRVWFEVYSEDKKTLPIDVMDTFSFKTQNERVWEAIHRLKHGETKDEFPVLPNDKTEKIHKEINGAYSVRYINGVLGGDRRNNRIMAAAYKVAIAHKKFIQNQLEKSSV
jgi:hypothetical protein